MAKKTLKQSLSSQRTTINVTIIGTIVGLTAALIGFLWAQELVVYDPEMVGANVGAGLLATFGLITVASSVLVLALTVMLAPGRKSKKR